MPGELRDGHAADADPRLRMKYEAWDNLPEGYREAAARMASFHALAEFVGVLPFIEWMRRAPDFSRKQMLVAKVQDEVGHGHVTARVAEDLGVSRERILTDFVEGRSHLLNIFHYSFLTWEEVGPGALLMNSAAMVQFQALDKGTYLPYARALRKIEKEESFHYHHALDHTHQTMTYGTREQRRLVQEAFETWLPRVLPYFGLPDSVTYQDNALFRHGLKVESNDALRQAWLAKVIPVFRGLGVHVDPALAGHDEERGIWTYAQPDWAEIKRIIKEGGPSYEKFRDHVAGSLRRNGRFREAARAVAA